MAARQQPSAALSNQIGEGVDTLWRLQLRKENAALLEKLEENAKAVQACSSEYMKHYQEFNKRIAGIEAAIAEIESVEEKALKAWELQGQDVADLKKKLDGGSCLSDGIPNASIDFRQRDNSVMNSPLRLTDHLTHSPVSERTRAHIRSSDQAHNGPSISTSSDLSEASITIVATTAKPNMATRKPIPRKRTKPASSNSKTQQHSMAKRVAPSKLPNKSKDFPRLIQSSASSIGAYHISANKLFEKLTLDRAGEVEFVARFVKGIQTAAKRNLLIKQLEKTNPSFTESGEQQILCEWADVAEALRRCGLVEIDNAVGAPPAKKKRRVLIPPEMIEDGMVRQGADSET